MTTETETPSIDLSAGLIPRKRTSVPEVDLSGGLVAKREGSEAPIAGPGVSEGASMRPPANGAPAAKRTENRRPLGTPGEPKTRQATRENGLDERVEPPATPTSIASGPAALCSAQPVHSEKPALGPVSPAVRSRTLSTPIAGEMAGNEPLQPARGRGPQAPLVSRSFKVREPQPEPLQPPPPAPAKNAVEPPGQSWERASSRIDDFQPESASEGVLQPEPEEGHYDAARRMSGLRNLILSLGLKNPNQLAEPVAREAEAPLPAEPRQQRPVYARPTAPVATAARPEDAGNSTTLVTAPPEFLPPKPAVEKTETQHSRANNSVSRRDRRDAYDDVEILPSWRGQYRKKG